VSGDGTHIYVTGSSWGGLPSKGGTGTDYATVAYDTAGKTLWVRRYNGPANGADVATAEAAAPGRVYVTGWSSGGAATGQDYETLAYASNGTLLWAQRYNGSTSGNDQATAIAVSPDGTKVFVTGDTAGPGGGEEYATLAYSSDGSLLWSANLGPAGPALIGVSPDGTRVYVSGQTVSTGFLTVAYDAPTGTQLWTDTYLPDLGFPIEGTGPSALAVSPDGTRITITGSRCLACGEDQDAINAGVTFTYSNQGALLWSQTYFGDCECADTNSVAMTPDGQTVYVGGADDVGLAGEFVIIAYNAVTGAMRWQRLPGPAGIVSAIVAGPGGKNIFATGSLVDLFTDLNKGFATVRVTSAGRFEWARHFTSPSIGETGFPAGIAVNATGTRVYVAATSPGTESKNDFVTIAYTVE
jgi:DNA-binding beta-propeller fold protein YncE